VLLLDAGVGVPPGVGDAGPPAGIGVVGSLEAGWLNDGRSGGFGSDMVLPS